MAAAQELRALPDHRRDGRERSSVRLAPPPPPEEGGRAPSATATGERRPGSACLRRRRKGARPRAPQLAAGGGGPGPTRRRHRGRGPGPERRRCRRKEAGLRSLPPSEEGGQAAELLALPSLGDGEGAGGREG